MPLRVGTTRGPRDWTRGLSSSRSAPACESRVRVAAGADPLRVGTTRGPRDWTAACPQAAAAVAVRSGSRASRSSSRCALRQRALRANGARLVLKPQRLQPVKNGCVPQESSSCCELRQLALRETDARLVLKPQRLWPVMRSGTSRAAGVRACCELRQLALRGSARGLSSSRSGLAGRTTRDFASGRSPSALRVETTRAPGIGARLVLKPQRRGRREAAGISSRCMEVRRAAR